MRRFLVASILAISIRAWAQTGESAQQIYLDSSDSVFLVYLNDASGKPTALGSAFLIAPRILITNAHVVDAGVPVIAVGPVRIPCKVIRKDDTNDLALIQVEVDLTSPPLKMASKDVVPGQKIFAIGNPKGLEKSISEGIVSGIRKDDGKSLLQITSPISHGSSGGPIFNADGEVVGVAVSFLEGGENLNFAVPIRYAKDLLDRRSDSASLLAKVTADQVTALSSQRATLKYSGDPTSDYQQVTEKLIQAMHAARQSVSDNVGLRTLACIGVNNAELTDDGIAAAKRLSGQSSLAGDRSLLSYVIYQSANNSYFDSIFAKDDSDEKRKALQEQQTFLGQAEAEALAVRQSPSGRRDVLAAYVLGSIYEDRSNLSKAVPLFEEVFASNFNYCGNDLSLSSLRSLISDSNTLGRSADAEKWFRTLVRSYQPTAYDWDAEGDRRAKEKDYVMTADAYERAASGADSLKIDVCYATADRWISPGDTDDSVLKDGRLCVDAAAENTDKKKNAEFDRTLPLVHRLIGEVLERRGVHEAALAEAKESLSEKPADPWALLLEADIYANTQKFAECISAATAAIQASDGKYSNMHFRLGYCYAQSGNLVRAEDSYRRAADIDPKDAVSAYDLALALQQQGFLSDAKHWFEEALKRNPDAELRAQIASAMSK